MTETAAKSDPKLWKQVKEKVQRGSKGGKPGQWSARKAQLAVHDYKEAGGGYEGGKSADNHLAQWTNEDWGTKSGKPSATTGERYLPKNARKALSAGEYARSTAKKRADTKRGKQFSAQPKDVAAKTAGARLQTKSLAELRRMASARKIAGRSSMKKADLLEAMSGAGAKN